MCLCVRYPSSYPFIIRKGFFFFGDQVVEGSDQLHPRHSHHVGGHILRSGAHRGRYELDAG